MSHIKVTVLPRGMMKIVPLFFIYLHMKIISEIIQPEDDPDGLFNRDSCWYYNHNLYLMGSSTHGMWISDHGKEFGLDIPELDFDSEWNNDWIESMKKAFQKGFVRIQKFNNIATITVLDFSKKEIDRIYEFLNDYSDYLSDCNYIEVVTLDWEIKYSDYNDSENYRNGNYICADSVKDLMEQLK